MPRRAHRPTDMNINIYMNISDNAVTAVSGAAGHPRHGSPSQRRPKTGPTEVVMDASTYNKRTKRNTNRGFRGREAIEKRRSQRSLKRQEKRREHRRSTGSTTRPERAQEPETNKIKGGAMQDIPTKVEYGAEIKVATVNVHGVKESREKANGGNLDGRGGNSCVDGSGNTHQ